ncbi:MAG: hypothetical protein ABIJ97_09460 [Bacteroidota bacterium]
MKPAKLYLITVIALAMLCCTKEPTPSLLEGKWIIKSAYLADNEYKDGKSYLEFHACGDSVCTGIDYDGEDQTTGVYTWTMDEQNNILSITDTLSAGGGYNADWLIESMTAKKMTISANTGIFGTMKMELKRD